ncbi:hypothetical protein QBC43DRAFT_291807 [Cladorrhinum sp. PSN259]|nr:hypothetical protein QBC43DRAFT_291807 [Cladorrhinum sp. PSN259]
MNSKKPKTRIDILDTWLKDKNTKGANGKTKTHDYPVKRDEDFRNTLFRCQEALKKPTIGESTRTFFAALALIKEKRPKIKLTVSKEADAIKETSASSWKK